MRMFRLSRRGRRWEIPCAAEMTPGRLFDFSVPCLPGIREGDLFVLWRSGAWTADARHGRRAGMRVWKTGAVAMILLMWGLLPAGADPARPALAAGDGTQSIAALQPLAEKGDAEAQVALAHLYLQGRGDAAVGIAWLEAAVAQGHLGAQTTLGMLRMHGVDMPKDPVGGEAMIRAAAEQGHLPAQYELGLLYAVGTEVAENVGEALIWYHKAAEAGYVKAQRRLALLYGTGLQVPLDRARMAYWIRMSAEAGDYDAQITLSHLYGEGDGVARDDVLAEYWYQRAVEQLDALRVQP